MTNLATRVDLSTMTGCCVRAAQSQPGLPGEGDTVACGTCGRALKVVNGRWRGLPAAESGPGGSDTRRPFPGLSGP
jgi:hypothetical protein